VPAPSSVDECETCTACCDAQSAPGCDPAGDNCYDPIAKTCESSSYYDNRDKCYEKGKGAYIWCDGVDSTCPTPEPSPAPPPTTDCDPFEYRGEYAAVTIIEGKSGGVYGPFEYTVTKGKGKGVYGPYFTEQDFYDDTRTRPAVEDYEDDRAICGTKGCDGCYVKEWGKSGVTGRTDNTCYDDIDRCTCLAQYGARAEPRARPRRASRSSRRMS